MEYRDIELTVQNLYVSYHTHSQSRVIDVKYSPECSLINHGFFTSEYSLRNVCLSVATSRNETVGYLKVPDENTCIMLHDIKYFTYRYVEEVEPFRISLPLFNGKTVIYSNGFKTSILKTIYSKAK